MKQIRPANAIGPKKVNLRKVNLSKMYLTYVDTLEGVKPIDVFGREREW